MQNNNNFINARFLEKLPFGTEFLLESKVNILTSRNGLESRSLASPHPKRKYKLSLNKLKIEDVESICGFFQNTSGALKSFRFKDITDFKALNQKLLNIDGGKGLIFRLIKNYSLLNQDGSFSSYQRLVTKPVENTIFIKDENGDDIIFNIDTNTGIIQFLTPQDKDKISASFEFDTHVRFETETLSLKYLSTGFEQSGDIIITEVL